MKNEKTQRTSAALLGAFLAKPGPLAGASDRAMIEIMTALAAHELTGEDLALAQRLRNEDPEADAFYQHLIESEAQTAEPATPKSNLVQELFAGLEDVLREFYLDQARLDPRGAPGDADTKEETIRIGKGNATYRQFKRPDGFHEIELIVPPSAAFDPAWLAGYGLKIVDRADPLHFKRRRNGNLVATAVLPPIDVSGKEIVVVPLPPAGPSRTAQRN